MAKTSFFNLEFSSIFSLRQEKICFFDAPIIVGNPRYFACLSTLGLDYDMLTLVEFLKIDVNLALIRGFLHHYVLSLLVPVKDRTNQIDVTRVTSVSLSYDYGLLPVGLLSCYLG